MADARTAWIITFTPAATEPRVLRQAAALVEAGWRVVVFGCDGRSPVPTAWRFVPVPAEVRRALPIRIALRALRELGMRVARFGPTAGTRLWGAGLHHGAVPHYRESARIIRRFQAAHPELSPDLVVSHDWFTAAAGCAAAESAGAAFAVDCHEYARGQNLHDAHWTKWLRPGVVAMQDHYLARADGVTTVCEGIADLLDTEQALRRPVRVVRSVPFRDPQPFRPTGETITVLYHGHIHYMRGLHKAIKSMPRWRPEFRLVIRGTADPQYVGYLEALVAELDLHDRVAFEPPVPFDEIVPAANRADIGYFVHKDLGPQKRFVLPNKFFEYVMAGLALCVSNLPEMARLVHRHEFGRLVDAYDEAAIAATINAFDRNAIDGMKRNALRAAEVLNWDAEKDRLLGLYEEIAR